VVRTALDAFVRREPDAMDGLFAPGAVLESSRPDRGTYHGPDGMRTWMADIDRDWEAFELTVHELRAGSRAIVALARIYSRTGGHVVDSPVALLFHTEGGLITRGRVCLDRAEAMRAAGLE
jgi:ketosteroid isomerase-like protein